MDLQISKKFKYYIIVGMKEVSQSRKENPDNWYSEIARIQEMLMKSLIFRVAIKLLLFSYCVTRYLYEN